MKYTEEEAEALLELMEVRWFSYKENKRSHLTAYYRMVPPGKHFNGSSNLDVLNKAVKYYAKCK